MEFKDAINEVKKSKNIFIMSHYDCDGLCSAKILSETLKRERKEINIKIVNELGNSAIKEIDKAKEDLVILSDLGSGYLSKLPDRKIIILDHHIPENVNRKNIIHINPVLDNKELCGAGVCYLFSETLNKNNLDLIDFAVVGAIGDNQIETGENKKIKKKAIESGRLKIEKGLNIFGHINRELHLSLKYADFFPLNQESEIIEFLTELEIPLNNNGKIKSYCDLSKKEKEKLILEIIKERIRNNIENPEDIFSDIYILTQQPRKLSDALEYSTILNAFGRLEKCTEALELMDKKTEKLYETMREYKQKIASYLEWVNKNIKNFIEVDNELLIIDSGKNIHENMIGTITSIMINNTNKNIIIGLAEGEEYIKISARSKTTPVDVIVKDICQKCGGYGGGHKKAAGGKIDKNKKNEFIDKILEVF